MKSFSYEGLPGRVVFGTGALDQIGAEIEYLQKKRALLIVTQSAAQYVSHLQQSLSEKLVAVIIGAAQHIPVETVEAGLNIAREVEADCGIMLVQRSKRDEQQ